MKTAILTAAQQQTRLQAILTCCECRTWGDLYEEASARMARLQFSPADVAWAMWVTGYTCTFPG